MTYIISYPRSGNTALRYLIELLSGQPTNGVCGPLNPKDTLQAPLIHKGRTDFVANKRHDFKGVKPTDTVLFIVRDPLEAVLRHNKHRGVTAENLMAWVDGWFDLYRKALKHGSVVIDYDALVSVADRASRALYRCQSNGPDHHKNELSLELRAEITAHIEGHWRSLCHEFPTARRIPASL